MKSSSAPGRCLCCMIFMLFSAESLLRAADDKPKARSAAKKRDIDNTPGTPQPFPPKITPPESGEGDQYPPGPDSIRQPGVPVGKQFNFDFDQSRIFPGTTRRITVYIPDQYKAQKPACLYIGLDALGFGAPIVFDNLIHKKQMPVTIAVGVSPGQVPSIRGGEKNKDNPRFNRSNEFDGLNGDLGRFINEEILPEVEKRKTPDGLPILISKNPDDRCTGGGSTGGIGAFTLAWEHPESFHRVFTAVGTFVGMRGGDRYPVLVRKTEPKPIRIFQQDGINDEWLGGPEVGDWWMGNLTMERALEFAGYDRNHIWGTGKHGGSHAAAIFPDAMRWLWRDWPAPVKAGQSQNLFLTAILDPAEGWQRVQAGDAARGFLTVDLKGEVSISGEPAAYDATGHMHRASEISRDAPPRDLVATSTGHIYMTQQDRVVMIRKGGERVILDGGIKEPSGIALSPDGLWLAVAESKTHWGYSYRVLADGSVDAKQRFYWFPIHDWADDSGAGNWRMDRDGRLYAATRMGVEVFDRNGRVRAILPSPDNTEVLSIAFGGEKFDTLHILTRQGHYKRKLKSIGSPTWAAPMQLPPWSPG